MTWQPGEVIVFQELWHGRLWSARPLFVVADGPDELVCWCPRGTLRKVPVAPPERPDPSPLRGERVANSLAAGDWVLVDAVWDVSTLIFVRPGDWYAIWISFLPSGEQWGWYVNFQQPFERFAQGVRAMDLALDVIVDPDRAWRWKDEDEFELLIERGLFDERTVEQVRGAADEVIGQIERGDAPFDGRLVDWRPDPAWGLPSLPAGYDAL